MNGNPIIEREFISMLRTRKALAIQVGVALSFAVLVALRWPSDARVELSGAQSQQVFAVFGYGLLVTFLLFVPVFPATSIVREKVQGTLELLFNSTMRPLSIYVGKLVGVLGFTALLLVLSIPAAAACYAMGGLSLAENILPLYAILGLAALQYATLALLVSSHANSMDSALRITYGFVLLLSVLVLGPHLFLQGQETIASLAAEWLRCLSPVPAVMDLLGHGGVGSQGLLSQSGVPFRYAVSAIVSTIVCAIATIRRLNYTIFDQPHDAGVVTESRRLLFLIDPQRRSRGIPWYLNPVMVKEFRCRRFGRLHWLLRLVALCALVSLGLTFAATLETMSWGVDTIGGIMVMLQVALIILVTPSLASGLISSEIESGGWNLMKMTPLSANRILRGKLLSVVLTLLLILLATLPGYVVILFIDPGRHEQVRDVLICLLLTAVFALILSATCSSLFRKTTIATVVSYAALVTICVGTMLVWLARNAPFGHRTVEAVLSINPMAAALNVIGTPGFEDYRLLPWNWWVTGGATAILFGVLLARVWRLTRPE